MAAQEEARSKQELVKEAEEMSTKQRFERLQKLLGKSKFYTDFLLQKMQVNYCYCERERLVYVG